MPNQKEAAHDAPEVKYVRPETLPSIMLVSARFRGAAMAPSTVDRRWTFALTDEGDGDALVGRSEVRLQPGVLLALEPGDCITPVRRRSDASSFRTLLAEPEYVTSF